MSLPVDRSLAALVAKLKEKKLLFLGSERKRASLVSLRSSAILPLPPFRGEGQNGRASFKKKMAGRLSMGLAARLRASCERVSSVEFMSCRFWIFLLSA